MSKNKIFLLCHSSVKWSNPGDFLKAQFVIFSCQKYVKKGYREMRKWIYLVPLKNVLGCPILHYSDLGQIGEEIEEAIQNNKSTSRGEYKQ